MTTTTKPSRFITPQTTEGKLILNYLNQACEEARRVCKKNGIEKYEDFSQMIRLIGERNAKEKGSQYLIRVGVKDNDLVLSLKNHPEQGATKTIKMKEHLGQTNDKYVFTRSNMEEELKPKANKEIMEQTPLTFESQNPQEITEKPPLTFASQKAQAEPQIISEEPIESIPEGLNFSSPTKTNKPQVITEDNQNDKLESNLIFSAEKHTIVNSSHPKQSKNNEKVEITEEDKLISEILTHEDQQEPEEKKEKKIQTVNNQRKTVNNQKSPERKKAEVNRAIIDVGEKLDHETEEVDGFTLMSSAVKIGAMIHALSDPNKDKLKNTIDRLNKLQARAKDLNERSAKIEQNDNTEQPTIKSTINRTNKLQEKAQDLNHRSEKIEETNLEENIEITEKEKLITQTNNQKNQQFSTEKETIEIEEKEPINEISQDDNESIIGKELQISLKNLNNEIQKLDPEADQPIIIDQNADLSQQLEQINKALDHLEAKLDQLEQRIEKIESQLADNKTENNELDEQEPITLKEEDRNLSNNNKEKEIQNNNKKEIIEQEPLTLIEKQTDEKSPELYSSFLATVKEIDEKYKQVNPEHNSVIEIGENISITTTTQDNTTTIRIAEEGENEDNEIFKAKITTDNEDPTQGSFTVETDNLSTEDMIEIRDSFDEQLDEIDQHLAESRQQTTTQTASKQENRQKQLSM